MYMLDSCVCIDFMRGRLPIGYKLFKESDPRLFRIPSVVVAELLTGAEKSSNPSANRNIVEQFLLPFQIAPFDGMCAHAYAVLRSDLERKGLKIGANDMLIAATAMANQARLVTNNYREFKRVDGLLIETWQEMDYRMG